jgi:hypothetical protein
MTITSPQAVLVNAMAEVGGTSYYSSGGMAAEMCYSTSTSGPWTAFADEGTNSGALISLNVNSQAGTPPTTFLVPFTREGYQTGLNGTYYFALCGSRSDGGSGSFTSVGYSKVIGMILQ